MSRDTTFVLLCFHDHSQVLGLDISFVIVVVVGFAWEFNFASAPQTAAPTLNSYSLKAGVPSDVDEKVDATGPCIGHIASSPTSSFV